MDAFEQHARAGLELAGKPADDTDLAVMRAVETVYGPAMQALRDADLTDTLPETALDPRRAPEAL